MALCIIMIFCNFTSRGFFKKKGTDAFFTIFFSCQKFFIILCNKDIDHSFVQWFRIEAILFCIFIFFYLMKHQYFIYIYLYIIYTANEKLTIFRIFWHESKTVSNFEKIAKNLNN